MPVRRLTPSDAAAYRALMLEAYALHPSAFTSDAGERAGLPLAWWEARLSPQQQPAEMAFGAWQGDALVGTAGLSFESRLKSRHKATLFGVYVRAAARQRGLSRALVDAALRQARALPHIRLVQLSVTAGNAAALSLYARFGFVEFGTEPLAIAIGQAFHAKVYMWCDLRPTPRDE